jgi:hypothetical protein
MSPKTGTKSVPLQDGPASPRRSNAPSRVSQRSRSTIQDGTERQRLDDIPVSSKTLMLMVITLSALLGALKDTFECGQIACVWSLSW